MGEVYRARDPRLGREVAIKVLTGATVADRQIRFEQEARATAVLAHPNILRVFDVGAHDGCPFLVYELLEGATLGALLEKGAIEPRRAVEYALQLTRGVAAAHALKIVHRDLKPDNIFITSDGTLKILDFGLAKLKRESTGPLDDTLVDTTLPGMILGTPAYMSPEQLRGEPIDERADVFAIGAILYEMITARNPFRRATAADTLAAILHETPQPLDSGKPLPAALQTLIFKCLEKDPAERFQSARALASALETLPEATEEPALRGPRAPGFAPAGDASSIAVLPFVDMSPTHDQGYLCDGISEELIMALTHIEGLRVASRSSTFQFRAPAVDIRAVGARLGVATVLEGGVRKSGDRLRVTVRLVDVANGYQRWSQRFDRKFEDVFAIQDEIAESVATALRGILSQREKDALRRPETAAETYEYYLRGRQLLIQFRRPALESAKKMFERAIELDPEYAPAWAGLADVHSWFHEWWGGAAEDREAADRASQKALELAPNLSDAHTSRGFALSQFRRYEESAREFQHAIDLNPKCFDAHYLYARTCFAWGRIEKSAELFRRAGDVLEEDFQSMILLGQSLLKLNRDAEAREAILEGIRRAERQLELNPSDARALSLGATALFEVGEHERAVRWSDRALQLYPDEPGVVVNAACLRAKAGLKEEALDLLEKAFARGWGKRGWVENDPDYDSLRDHPRFKALVEKLA
jgi:non-specific serine/threonine protein kinase